MPKDRLENIVIEAELAQPKGGLTGREWEVTILGPKTEADLIKIDGREYVRSMNGRFYDTRALEESAVMWDGIKVYDNHLTQTEFKERGQMRSPNREWLGNIVNVTWDATGRKLRGVFKVVEDALARKLKNALEQGLLGTVGLSIDAGIGREGSVMYEGRQFPVIESFSKVLSVDFVSEPAAGGAFNRILASQQENIMDEQETGNGVVVTDEMKDFVNKAIEEALVKKAEEAEDEIDVDELDDEEALEAVQNLRDKKTRRKMAEEEKELAKIRRAAEAEQQKAALARSELMVDQRLAKAHLPTAFETQVRVQFEGRVVEAAAVDKAINLARESYASLDPTGRVRTGGISEIRPGVDQDERVQLVFARSIMGDRDFAALESSNDDSVKNLLLGWKAYQSWKNNGKPALPRYNRTSTMFYEWFGGDPLLDHRAFEAATTSSLGTVVKNTVNITAANRYSQRELWFERIVNTLEVDTIDDATLARVYGVDSLPVVPEGAAYTELNLADEEETASFVKKGGYIGVTLEVLMRDKINEIRNIPTKLADTWYNTLADLVSGVFTINAGVGPTLGTTGALFNNTAASSAGGHTNLLTTALSYSAFGAARTAMRKQTDQPLGAGRRLVENLPRYLLVPVDLEVPALGIRNSELQPDADFDSGAAGSGAQTTNLYRGQFEVIVVPTWTDPTDWALVADPMAMPAIWLVYPRGMRTPQVFSSDSETSGTMFTNDEMRFKVRLMTYRFSASADCAPVSDFRPLHKSNVSG